MIRADVHIGPDGRPKGSGIVAFESPNDARNAIQQFNGYDWQGRNLEVREDRFANNFAGRGGFGGARGGFGGGFAGRGGPAFGARGGFAGGFGGRGGFGGGFGGPPHHGGFDGGAAAGAPSAPPNPFTDYATAGTERSETIYVRNVSRTPGYDTSGDRPDIILASMVHQQRGSRRALHYHRKGRASRDSVRAKWTFPRNRCRSLRYCRERRDCHLQILWLPVWWTPTRPQLRQVPDPRI